MSEGPRGGNPQQSGSALPIRLLLAIAMAAAVALYLWEMRSTTFVIDQWAFFATYEGWSPGTLFKPDAGHLTVVPVILFKAKIAAFGPDHLPFRIESAAINLAVAGVVFAYARPRIGAAAIIPAVLVLFLGTAWLVIVSPVGVPYQLAIGAAAAALLALDRGGPRGAVLACALLLVAAGSFEFALAFVAGIGVELVLRDGKDAWRRAWIVALPVVLYGIWRIWARKFEDTPEVGAETLAALPASMLDALSAALAGLTGLSREPGQTGVVADVSLTWGRPLAVIALLALGWWLYTTRPRSPRLWGLLAMLAVLLVEIGLGLGPGRPPNSSRYTYPVGIAVLLVAVEVGGSLRIRRTPFVVALAATLTAISIASGVANLHYGGVQLRNLAEIDRVQLAALELARPVIESNRGQDLLPIPSETWSVPLRSRDYFDAIDRHGSPAASREELSSASDRARQAADKLLALEYQLLEPDRLEPEGELRAPPEATPPTRLGTRGAAVRVEGGCLAVRPREGARVQIALPSGGVALQVAGGPAVEILLGRFSDTPSFEGGVIAGGGVGAIRIPVDASPVPWRATLSAAQPFRACAI